MTKILKVGKSVPVTLVMYLETYLIRPHQVVADSHLVTIYSAPIYGRQFSNLAGVPQVDNNLFSCRMQIGTPSTNDIWHPF
ncbi:hypothetical protein T07_7624 [Trichinella nelsoni]|uniref:Uncharacterized protein n=1 Tax=Trichinella nelsoni TaxID=6336 RepID=A0A0V0S296_9BILA|nr:hypothetical protein T07_7624 [Trichinella nelsoni]